MSRLLNVCSDSQRTLTCVSWIRPWRCYQWYLPLTTGVDYKTSTKVTGVDASKQTVTTESGETISYEKLIYALGARVRQHGLTCRSLTACSG